MPIFKRRRQQVDEKYKLYLYDLGLLLKENALTVRSELRTLKKNSSEYDISWGILHGYCRVISLVQNEAVSFGIDLKELRLDDIDPDKDLVM